MFHPLYLKSKFIVSCYKDKELFGTPKIDRINKYFSGIKNNRTPTQILIIFMQAPFILPKHSVPMLSGMTSKWCRFNYDRFYLKRIYLFVSACTDGFVLHFCLEFENFKAPTRAKSSYLRRYVWIRTVTRAV